MEAEKVLNFIFMFIYAYMVAYITLCLNPLFYEYQEEKCYNNMENITLLLLTSL